MVNHHADCVAKLDAKEAEPVQSLIQRQLVEHLCEDSQKEEYHSVRDIPTMILDVVDVVRSKQWLRDVE